MTITLRISDGTRWASAPARVSDGAAIRRWLGGAWSDAAAGWRARQHAQRGHLHPLEACRACSPAQMPDVQQYEVQLLHGERWARLTCIPAAGRLQRGSGGLWLRAAVLRPDEAAALYDALVRQAQHCASIDGLSQAVADLVRSVPPTLTVVRSE